MKKIIVTVGPSLLYRVPLAQIHRPYLIYRINGAHGTLPQIQAHLNEIRRQIPAAEILLDLPGNKIRTDHIQSPIAFAPGQQFTLEPGQTTFPDFYRHLEPGMELYANDGTCRFEVVRAGPTQIRLLSHSQGCLLNNKGLHVRGIHDRLPFLFPKDHQLIRLANRQPVDYVGLSFVRSAADVRCTRTLFAHPVTFLCKIETAAAVNNLDSILELADNILIDRGDLSAEIGLQKIPAAQEYILWKAHFYNKQAFLATQLLRNFIDQPLPTIAEVDDLYRHLKNGIYGIQLSEETAIGAHPKECLDFIECLVREVSTEQLAAPGPSIEAAPQFSRRAPKGRRDDNVAVPAC